MTDQTFAALIWILCWTGIAACLCFLAISLKREFVAWRQQSKREAAYENLVKAMDRERAAVLQALAEDAKAKMAERQQALNGGRVDWRRANDFSRW